MHTTNPHYQAARRAIDAYVSESLAAWDNDPSDDAAQAAAAACYAREVLATDPARAVAVLRDAAETVECECDAIWPHDWGTYAFAQDAIDHARSCARALRRYAAAIVWEANAPEAAEDSADAAREDWVPFAAETRAVLGAIEERAIVWSDTAAAWQRVADIYAYASQAELTAALSRVYQATIGMAPIRPLPDAIPA